MKILIVGLSKIKYMPYLNFYYDSIDFTKNSVHICYWNRDEKPEDVSSYKSAHLHEFAYRQLNNVKKVNKIASFIRYRLYIRKLMKRERYDFVIFLQSLTGVLIGNYLKPNQYIFDYRDSTFEHNSLYKKRIATLVNNSYATFVSSRGFLNLLPDSKKIIISHNMSLESLEYRDFIKEKSARIRIVFWGYTRNIKMNTTMIERVSKDDRFELHYHGFEDLNTLQLKKFANAIGSRNVFFHGEYKPKQRYDFIKKTDLLHNLFDDPNLQIAVANKYYDGIIFRTPQLCFRGSLMGKMVSNLGLGFECSPFDENFLDQVYQYYQNLDFFKLFSNCDRELENVIFEHMEGQNFIRSLGKQL